MKTILHVIDTSASRAEVYEALTTETGLSAWWSTKVTAGEATVGSVIHFTFVGDFNRDMELTEVEPDAVVGWKRVRGHDPWQDNTVRFEIVDVPGGRTRIRFRQDYATELDDDYLRHVQLQLGLLPRELPPPPGRRQGQAFPSRLTGPPKLSSRTQPNMEMPLMRDNERTDRRPCARLGVSLAFATAAPRPRSS